MTQTNTDYLFQVTTPATDRGYSTINASGGAGRFDNLLSRASTSSGDDLRSDNGLLRNAPTRNDGGDLSWHNDSSKQVGHENGSGTLSTPQPARQDDPPSAASDSKSPTTDTRRDGHDDDESDDTTSAEVAGASQVSNGHPPKSDDNSGEHASGKLDATAKTEVNDKAAVKAAELKTKANAHKQVVDKATQSDAAEQNAAAAAEPVAEPTADESETTEASEKLQAEGIAASQQKTAETGTTVAKSKAADATKTSGACDEAHVEGTATGETSPEAGQKITDPAQVDAAAAPVKAKQGAAATDDKSDDDSAPTARNDAQSGARIEQAVQAVKVDAVQVAGPVPSATDAVPNAAKGKSDERGAKPIAAATGESVTAAFARMARASDAGVSGSGSNTNDTPQIDPSRFIGRVAKAFQTAQDRGGTVQLRLSPPELGVLRIELNVKDGVMSASLQAESSSARKLLLDHLPALRDRLAEQNIRVDRFDVDVCQDGSDGQANTRGSQQQQFQQQSEEQAPRRQAQTQARASAIAVAQRVAATPTVSDTGLNLIV